MLRRHLLAILALGATLTVAPGAWAEDKAASAAAKAGDKARAALPEPKEGRELAYEGEVWIDGVWGGSVRLKAEVGSFAEKPCWLVTEDVFWDFSGTEWRVGLSATLRRDLTLERAEVEHKVKGRVTRTTLARGEGGWKGQRQVIEGENESPFEDVSVAAPAGASLGLTALALLGRGPLPSGEAAFSLPWLDAVAWALAPATAPATLRWVAKGEGTFEAAPNAPPAWSAALEGLTWPSALHVDRKQRALLGFVGVLGEKAVVLPAGQRPAGAGFDERGPARTWQAAFLKFGVGYHMARRELLEAAFHWPTMYEYETSLVDGWPKEKPLAEFKEAWIGEFLQRSLHRSRPETDDLLKMTLATGRPEEKGADRVIFHAHANFGGGQARAYHFKRLDGVWYLVRMEDE